MKKKLISTLAVCSIACCIGGISTIHANADAYDDAFISIVPLPGAAVRLGKNENDLISEDMSAHGIRFQAVIPTDTYNTLEASETETRTVNYGIIIAPLDYETTYGEYTKENLFGANRKYYIEGVTDAGDGLRALTGKDRATLGDYEADATKKIVSGALVNIPTSQLTREFVGIPYIRITDGDNAEFYTAEYKDARSMVYVAQRAIQSGTLTAEESTYLSDYYVNYKDGTTDIASKQYTYTVEHIALDSNGKEIEVLESYTADKTTLGTTVSVEPNEYVDYTYDEELSTASDIIYANNRTALKMYYKLGIPMTPHLRQENGAVISGMSLEKQTEGEFAGAYKYVNGQLGRAGTSSLKYGQLGIAFDEVYNANNGYIEGTQNFFAKGYKYIKLDFYATSSVYSFDFRHGSSTSSGWLQELKAGSTFSSNNVFEIYDANGDKVNKWTAGEWYTLVIKPTQGEMLYLQTNAQTSTSEAPVMYIKNLAYRSVHPFPEMAEPESNVTLTTNTNYATLEWQGRGDFAGSYKYTNIGKGATASVSLPAGVYFQEVYDYWGNGYLEDSQTFFSNYKYIRLDFYATDSVYSLDLQNAWTGYVQGLTENTTFTSDVFAIYNASGKKVNKWTVGAWYTLVIEPQKGGQWDYPLAIETNASSTSVDPVMYIKNVSYETKEIGESANLFIRSNRTSGASVVYQTEGEYANAWKYTNTSYAEESQYGFMFDQIQDVGGNRLTTFFDNGYGYISLQFYVATSTVDSLVLRHQDTIYKYVADVAQTNDYFMIYDANGNKVNKWTAGAWYTLVIKPAKHTNGDGKAGGVYVGLYETTSSEDAPVMYIKNPNYLVNNPFAS